MIANQLPVPMIVGLSVLTVTSLVYYFIRKKRQLFINECKIKKLFIYPIKSVKGVEVDQLEITKYGVKYGVFKDRSWVLLTDMNRRIGLRNEPKLALTRTSIVGDELWVDGPDMTTLKIKYIDKINSNHNIIEFKLDFHKGNEIKGIVCSDECNNWWQTFLDKPGVQLVQHHPSFAYRATDSFQRRTDDNKYPIIYQNKSDLHLMNDQSIRDLNTRFPVGADQAYYENFRPNILVDHPMPWIEDHWKWMRINGVNFLRLLPCDRCGVTSVNQKTGERNMEILAMLKTFRPPTGITKQKGLGPSMGVIFGHLSNGFINVNDNVEVIYGEFNDF